MNWKTLTLVCGLTATTLAQAWPGYDLYTLTGYGTHPTEAFGLNSFADTVGLAQPGSNTYVFDGYFSGPGLLNEYTPRGGWASLEFTGINDDYYMIGSATIGYTPTAVGCQYGGNPVDMTAGIQNLGQSQALGINHNGDAVGSYDQQTSKGIVNHMFRWSSVSNIRTNDVENLLPGGINENGVVVASNLKPTNYYQLAELDFIPKTGPTTKVLAPGNLIYIYPSGISTYGGVTAIGLGDFPLLNSSGTHLTSWAYNQAAAQWYVLDAPGNPDYQSNALAVDVWGTHIVGYTTDASSNQTATVWEFDNGNWTATYLSDLIPNQPNWKFQQATGINTYGAISGWGLHYEHEAWVERAFVATPKLEIRAIFPEGGVFGGLTVNPTVRASAQNPFAVDVKTTTTTPGVSVPRLVVMPGMATTATFAMKTQGVDTETTGNVTVQLGALQYTQTFAIHPAALSTLTLTPNRDEAGGFGVLGLHGAAGPSGVTVKLASSDLSIVVPATLTIPAGASTGQFRITLGRKAVKGATVTIEATFAGNTVSQPFTVN